MNRVLKLELLGILFVFSLGALLHFVFEWSGESPLAGAFASVNESVWEHFKQGFWPMVLWAAIEYRFIRGAVNNFLTAKAVAVYLIPTVTALVFLCLHRGHRRGNPDRGHLHICGGCRHRADGQL